MKKHKASAAVVDLVEQSEWERRREEVELNPVVRALKREVRRLSQRLQHRETGLEMQRQAFQEAYAEPLDIYVQPPPKQSSKKHVEEAVLHLSDIHLGKRTETYNAAVAEQRLIKATESVYEITEMRRNNAKIEKLHVYLGGDMVEGSGGIFPGQAHEMDLDIVQQAGREGAIMLTERLLFLSQLYPEIHIAAVPGNHGRGDRFNSKRHNFDSWLYYGTQLLLEKALPPKRRERISWDLPFDRPGHEWYAHDTICDRWGVLLVHGDQIRGQLGMPWYGIGKKAFGWIDSIQYPWDYLFMGHFHTAAMINMNHRVVLANGTTESSNVYAAEEMGGCGTPCQRFCFFNAQYGLLSDCLLQLGDMTPNR